MKDLIEKRIIALFLLVLTLLVGVTVAALRNIQSSAVSSDWVNQTHALISETEGVFSSLNAGDAALRSYLLAVDERDRAAARRSFSEAVEHLDLAKALAGSGTKQQAEIIQLYPLVARRVDFARDAINLRQQKGLEAVRKLIATDAGSMLEIQHHLESIKEQCEELLRARDKASYLQAQNTRWTVFTGVGINILVLAFLFFLIRDDLASRRKAAAVLSEANQKLDATVKARTVELAATNDALAQENLEQRWANQALDHQLRYNQLIINSIDDLVFVISKALNVSRINPAVTRGTGFESQELVGAPLHRVLRHPEAQNSVEPVKFEKILSCLKDGRDLLDAPGILCLKDGRKMAIAFNVFPLRDRDKIVGGVLTIKIREPQTPASAS